MVIFHSYVSLPKGKVNFHHFSPSALGISDCFDILSPSADEDIPLHFIFGIQLEGTLELRPKKLAQIYLRRLAATPGVGGIPSGKSERSERDDGIMGMSENGVYCQ